jgi:hypothetical protein
MPARIGTPFIKNFMEAGSCLLTETGELRVVVINDLAPVLKNLAQEIRWPLTEVTVGPRHSVFSMTRNHDLAVKPMSPAGLYYRDTVRIKNLEFKRPFDMGGDDQKRLKSSLPILLDTLPRHPLEKNARVLCFRSYYGTIPLIARKLFSDANVTVYERDLLSLFFLNENAKHLGLDSDRLQVREAPSFSEALEESVQSSHQFDLILGELSPSAGELVANHELNAAYQNLKPGGQALIVCFEKNEQDWVKPFAEKEKIKIQRILTREGFTVIRLTR